MSNRRGHAALVALLAAVLFASAMGFFAPRARAGISVVFIEDFESGAIASGWSRADNNPTGGLDYWDVSDWRAHAGNYSAWSAQIGQQSDTGLNNSAVHQYDDSMQADLVVDLRANGFTSLTLSFYYWSRAESGGGDFIQAWYEAAGNQTIIFTNTGGTGNKWDLASVAVPNDVERLIIRFQTDPANHGFEGAYVDDIVLTGTEDVAPTSRAGPLPGYTNQVPYPIPYTAQDNSNASGVAYVELYWRASTAGNFTLYNRSANPLGRWYVSPISFDPSFAVGDGYYEFYTIAYDNAQNAEAPPASADASMTIDTEPPVLTITAPTVDAWMNASSASVLWQGSDGGSGLDRYEVAVDGGAATSVALATSHAFTGLGEGTHEALVTAFDRAGNDVSRTIPFGVDTVAPNLSITAPTERKLFHTQAVTFRWSGGDDTSGLDRYEVWLDGGVRQTPSGTEFTVEGITDGDHVFHIVAYDRAGNAAQAQLTFRVATSPWSWDGPYGPFPLVALLLVALLLLLALLLLWRWRREELEETSTGIREPQSDREREARKPDDEAQGDSAQPPEGD